MSNVRDDTLMRRRGRVVDGARLESVFGVTQRRFESYRLRHFKKKRP